MWWINWIFIGTCIMMLGNYGVFKGLVDEVVADEQEFHFSSQLHEQCPSSNLLCHSW